MYLLEFLSIHTHVPIILYKNDYTYILNGIYHETAVSIWQSIQIGTGHQQLNDSQNNKNMWKCKW